MTAKIVKLSTSELFPSPENRPDRSGFDAKSLAELAGSYKVQGIIEPLIVRPGRNGKAGKGYEIVCGERRWTAATLEGIPKEVIKDLGLQKLTEVPCVVTEMSDTEVREVRLIENLHREGIHPIEEAKAYKALLEEVEEVPKDGRGASAGVPKKKYTIETLAKKLGKSPTFLYARLKLLKMPTFAQQAMFGNKLNGSVALLLCRIPDPKLAHQAALEVLDPDCFQRDLTDEQREKRALDPENEPMSVRAAKAHIQNKYMIRLKGAPFDQEDVNLVPVIVTDGERSCGGKCSDCPLRTGNMKALFQDVDSADVCTNPTCFHLKKKAAFKKEQEKFKTKGQTLLTEGKARSLLDYEGKELNAKVLTDVMFQVGLSIAKDKPEHVLKFVAKSLFENWDYRQRHGLEGEKSIEKHIGQLATLPLLMEHMVEASLPRRVTHEGDIDPSIQELCDYFEVALDKITAKHNPPAAKK